MANVMRRLTWAMIVAALMIALGACQSNGSPTPAAGVVPRATLTPGQVIVVGDIEPDEPALKVELFQPLADYLAENLKALGVVRGRVVLARDVQEMAQFLNDGKVDIYLDSSFPSLAVQELSRSRVILRRWKQGDPTYWSIYVALRDGGISRVEDFVGKTIAFEEPHSTSGFVLPAGTLIRRGFTLREIDRPGAPVGDNEVGYFFSRDEENTFEMILQGKVAGGGISNQDYDALPEELRDRIVAFDRTIEVPRQLVSVRPGLDKGLAATVKELLINLDQTEDGRSLLLALKNTQKFDALPSGSNLVLRELRELIRLVSKG